MSSSLTWIDHDQTARERSLRILALFQEKESRDELGLGAIRDSFADKLFPGTSTIQTRLRYMLFIPWIYKVLEDSKISPDEFAGRADSKERDLIEAMRNTDKREQGIFGGRSGRQLKRLPSSVYWSGLGSWGIRLMDLSQDQYHRQIGLVYRRRKEQAERTQEREDEGGASLGGTATWHPKLPGPPADFPSSANFSLTEDEASFLLDRLKQSHPTSLLAHLALHSQPVEIAAPWNHPDFSSFTQNQQELLQHGQRFSGFMFGAAIVYNIELAKLRDWEEKTEEHRELLQDWLDALDFGEVRSWSLDRLWELTQEQGHNISYATRRFVEQWVGYLNDFGTKIAEESSVQEFVKRREMSLKKSRSRFSNKRALEQWTGYSGLVRMTYRWGTAKTFLKDLHAGLVGGKTTDA